MEPISVKLSYAGAHRRFKIKGDDFESLFADLMTHVAQLSAQGPPFDIAWQDEDGDSILISRPAELGEAIESRKDGLLRLHTIEKTNENSTSKSEKETETSAKTEEAPKADTNTNDAIHGNILCDVCDATVVGIRYKCILCVDYDLCQNCERTGVHAQHGMVRIVDPMRTYVPWGARLRYTRQPGEHHHAHRSADPHGVIHRFRMQEKKEQLTEQVAKGMQYLTDIGQVVTSALANFGIDASYEVQVPGDKKEEKAEAKSQEKAESKTEGPEEKKDEKVEKSGSATPRTPSSPPNTPKYGMEDEDRSVKKEKKSESEKRAKFGQPIIMCPKKKFDNLRSAEAAHKKFDNLQSAEAAYRRATAKTSDGSAKTSEHRREQDAEMRKETRTAPTFGVGARCPMSSSRGLYSRLPFDYTDNGEVRGKDLYDEYQRRRNEDRYDDRRSRHGVRFDEQKRTRDAHSDMSSRDRRRWWSPSYDDYWTSSSRRGARYEGCTRYDPYEDLFDAMKQNNAMLKKDEKVKNNRESRVGEKKSTEIKQKRAADSTELGIERDRENDVRRRAEKFLEEVSGRKKNSLPAEEGLKAAVEEAAREPNGRDGRDTNCRCFVTKWGRSEIRSQTCPACQAKVMRSEQSSSRYAYMRGMSDEAVPAAEEQIERKREINEPETKVDVKQDVLEPKCKHFVELPLEQDTVLVAKVDELRVLLYSVAAAELRRDLVDPLIQTYSLRILLPGPATTLQLPKAADSYDHCCSTDGSSDSDSDFEALSYESIPDEFEKEKHTCEIATAPPVEQGTAPAPEQETTPAAVPEAVANPASVGTLYPTLSAEPRPVEPARVGEDQSIVRIFLLLLSFSFLVLGTSSFVLGKSFD
ncbi:hypothetical protein Y032_0184g1008 [Ancylostoma ceylanicum]|uniref:Zinc finger, ZZ type n=1 Tax=Ancylostoma ceylanicum TaxID=53326 RepID=A0A016SS41_9BILA|nr:hypothetical protein Y032_0184g1008 [Ancylostoma ceylanicum]